MWPVNVVMQPGVYVDLYVYSAFAASGAEHAGSCFSV